MYQGKHGAMRYLLSSAFLNGRSFRREVRGFVESPVKSIAPDSSINMNLLAQVCETLDRHENYYDFIFLGLLLLIALTLDLGDASFIAVLAGLACGILLIVKERRHRRWVKQYFQTESFDLNGFCQDFLGQPLEMFDTLPDEQNNVVIYEGFNPFVGGGNELNGWSLSIDLTRPSSALGVEEPVKALDTDQLYDALCQSTRALGLPNVDIKDLLFINGAEIRDKKTLLPNAYARPVANLSAEDFTAFYEQHPKQTRHYKLIQVRDWSDDLILSFYVRLSRQGSNLFVETSRFLLPPVASKYRKLDTLSEQSLWLRLSIGLIALLFGVYYAIYAAGFLVLRGVGRLFKALGRLRNTEHKAIRSNPQFNYGAKASFREVVAGEVYQHYFQKLDKELYVKTLERSLLDTLVVQLEAHNIDSTDLAERKTTIINSGVIVSGGDVKANALAVGAQASAGVVPRKKAG